MPNLLSEAHRDRRYKHELEKGNSYEGKKIFPVRVVKHWHRDQRGQKLPSLEILLCNPIYQPCSEQRCTRDLQRS